MRTAVRLTPSLPVLFSALTLVGCSRGIQLGEVKGTVKLNGKPLPKIMVEFVPDLPTGPRSLGTTDENGQYTLVCDNKQPGALVGPHRVVLHDLAVYGEKGLGRKLELVGTPGGPTLNPPRIPNYYEHPTQTPIRKEVKAGSQVIDLDLKGR
jgi:hypothetical protein